MCVNMLFLGASLHFLSGYAHMSGSKKSGRGIFHTHLGFYLASTLCSAPTLWRQPASHPASVFLIPSRCWEAVRFSALVSDILHLPREAGQPCHSNVKHMWNRPGQSRPTHTQTHRTEDGEGRRRPEPHWSFPLCIRVNSGETIEMQRWQSHLVQP